MYDIETIYEPQNIAEAIALLTDHPESVVIAGGSDVLIKIREGKMAGCCLVSIGGIKELEGISISEGGTITIGPLTTFSHITHHPLIQKHLPMLGAAVDQVGGPQVRNIATIGGNICNGVTSADSASTLFTYNALLEITGPQGMRAVPISAYYKGPGKVNLQKGELLTAIKITKANYEGFSGHYIKYAMRQAMDIATLGCAVNCKVDLATNTLVDLRLAFGVAGPTPMRCFKTEASLKGTPLTPELFQTIGTLALQEVNPRTSWRASKDFRIQLVSELSSRALRRAITLAGGPLYD